MKDPIPVNQLLPIWRAHFRQAVAWSQDEAIPHDERLTYAEEAARTSEGILRMTGEAPPVPFALGRRGTAAELKGLLLRDGPLTTPQVCERLPISRSELHRLWKQGHLAKHCIGKYRHPRGGNRTLFAPRPERGPQSELPVRIWALLQEQGTMTCSEIAQRMGLHNSQVRHHWDSGMLPALGIETSIKGGKSLYSLAT